MAESPQVQVAPVEAGEGSQEEVVSKAPQVAEEGVLL